MLIRRSKNYRNKMMLKVVVVCLSAAFVIGGARGALGQTEVEEHLEMLRGTEQQVQRALGFFADYDKPLNDNKTAVVKLVVSTIEKSIAGQMDSDGLQTKALAILEKLNPQAIQAAYRTLSRYTSQVYKPASGRPAIGNETLFIYIPQYDALIALDIKTWVEKWRNTAVPRGLPVYHKGKVLCAGVAVNADTGEIQWKYDRFELSSTPVVAKGGTFYFTPENDRYVVALNATSGREKWVYDARGKMVWQCQPLVANDTVYVLTNADRMKATLDTLYALNVENGERRWIRKFKAQGSRADRIYAWDDRLYLDAGKRIAAINASNGRILGYSTIISRKPVVVGDQLVGYKDSFVSKKTGKNYLPSITCLNLKTNKGRWRLSLGKLHQNASEARQQTTARHIPPATDGERACFFLQNPVEVLCIEAQSGKVDWKAVPPDREMSLTHGMTIHDGRLYLAPKNRVMEVDMETGNEVQHKPLPSMR